ncbi:hypothetical protein YC2023_046634 [Brassica napus]
MLRAVSESGVGVRYLNQASGNRGLVLKHADDGSSHNNKTTPGDCKHLAKHLLTFEEFLFEHPLTSHVIKTAYYF